MGGGADGFNGGYTFLVDGREVAADPPEVVAKENLSMLITDLQRSRLISSAIGEKCQKGLERDSTPAQTGASLGVIAGMSRVVRGKFKGELLEDFNKMIAFYQPGIDTILNSDPAIKVAFEMAEASEMAKLNLLSLVNDFVRDHADLIPLVIIDQCRESLQLGSSSEQTGAALAVLDRVIRLVSGKLGAGIDASLNAFANEIKVILDHNAAVRAVFEVVPMSTRLWRFERGVVVTSGLDHSSR